MAKEASKAPDQVDSGLTWDTESKHQLISRAGHIRDNSIFLTVGLTTWMEDVWNNILTYVKTATDPNTSEVVVARATEGEKGAMQVRRYGAQNAATFNFFRPLRKLNLKIPADRQFNVTPFTREVPGVGMVFVFPMKDRVSVPRNLKDEQEEGAQPAKADAAKAAPAKATPAPASAPAPAPAAAPAQAPTPAPAAEAAAAKESEPTPAI